MRYILYKVDGTLIPTHYYLVRTHYLSPSHYANTVRRHDYASRRGAGELGYLLNNASDLRVTSYCFENCPNKEEGLWPIAYEIGQFYANKQDNVKREEW